ncbi:MAG: hypothetical protein HOP08_03585 [Cyclobacteriaceae bacterium]|nr:hypothetical protein [Cyclobacteriaceae bacterium]
MKTALCTTILSILITFSVNAQLFNSSHVPEEARVNFNLQYPKAKQTNWTKDTDGYQVRFRSGRHYIVAVYDLQGRSVAEILKISKDMLPTLARKQLRENYASYAIEDAVKIKSVDGRIVYGTHIGTAEESLELVFNDSGYMISITSDEISTD